MYMSEKQINEKRVKQKCKGDWLPPSLPDLDYFKNLYLFHFFHNNFLKHG